MTTSSKTLRYALTGALAGALLAGTASAGNPEKNAAADAARAQAALAKGQAGKAVTFAEAAVLAKPGDAGLRALLGQTYLRAGRFESAAVTLGEARQLGDAGGRTALSLALANIGRGQQREAVALLDASREVIGADDLGLAYALAGETGRGVAILSDAIRGGEPTAKLRQNLAYAYALDNRWREARVMMMSDVPANEIDDRVSDWAARAQPEAYQARVANLVGAPVIADSGRPDRLALVTEAPAEQLAAAEAPAAEPVVPAVTANAELPAVAASDDVPPSLAVNAPVATDPAPQPAPASESFATAFAATSQAVIQAVPMQAPRVVPVRTVKARPAIASRPVVGGTHLVQLGSFSSEANARRAWTIFTARNASLRNYRLTITPVVVRGKNFWRVAAAGFNAGSASSMCGTVKSRGGACFAYAAGRPMRSDTPTRFADAGGSRTARR